MLQPSLDLPLETDCILFGIFTEMVLKMLLKQCVASAINFCFHQKRLGLFVNVRSFYLFEFIKFPNFI